MQQVVRRYLSESSFLALPPSLERLELVDGEVVVTPGPSYHHQKLARRLVLALEPWCAAAPGAEVLFAPLDLRLGRDRIVQPDLLVLPHGLSDDHAGPVELLPILVVEISSRNADYDRRTKRLLYGEADILEYWVVDPAGAVEIFHGLGLRQRVLCTDRATSVTLAGLDVDLAALFG